MFVRSWARMILRVRHLSIDWIFLLLLDGYLWQLPHLKFFLIAIMLCFLTYVYHLIWWSCRILWDFFTVLSGILSYLWGKMHTVHCHFSNIQLILLLNSHYEEYLSASFPFGSYSQIFIAPEMAISSLSLGASLSIFSSQLLFDDKVIDQVP